MKGIKPPVKTQYFPHDYGHHDTDNMIELIDNFGWEGYGIYWGIIEYMAQRGGNFQYKNLNLLAAKFRVRKGKFKLLIDWLLLNETLKIDSNVVTSQQLDEHFATRNKLKVAGFKGSEHRKTQEKDTSQAEATPQPGSSQASANKGKEIKGKESNNTQSEAHEDLKNSEEKKENHPPPPLDRFAMFDDAEKLSPWWDKWHEWMCSIHVNKPFTKDTAPEEAMLKGLALMCTHGKGGLANTVDAIAIIEHSLGIPAKNLHRVRRDTPGYKDELRIEKPNKSMQAAQEWASPLPKAS